MEGGGWGDGRWNVLQNFGWKEIENADSWSIQAVEKEFPLPDCVAMHVNHNVNTVNVNHICKSYM